MAKLNDIKKRIQGINTTSKITQAMKLVATARIQRQKTSFLELSKFVYNLYILLKNLSKNVDFNEVFDIKNIKSNCDLYVVISSSLGLCGPYNINVCKQAMNSVRPEDKIIVVGERGYDYLKNHGFANQIITQYNVGNNSRNYYEIAPLTLMVTEAFKQGNYKTVHLIYTKYKNSLSFEPVDLQILPFDNSMFNPEASADPNKYQSVLNDNNQVIETLTKRSTIIKNFISFIVGSVIISAIDEARLCEYTSRRNAMESATDNAKEIIEDLKQKYNQARQEKITQEINEIIAGSGEMKG